MAVLLAASLASCSSTDYRVPIASFQESVANGTEAVATYFAGMNRFERDLYLHEVAYDAGRELATAEKTPEGTKPTALSGKVFSPRSIQARVDALRLVGLYALGLGELVNSEAPSAFGESTVKLGEQLAQTFTKLKDGGDDGAKEYLGPLTAIVAEVGKRWVEGKRDAMIAASIEVAAPEVQKVLARIEADLRSIVTPLRETGEKAMLSVLVRSYNKSRAAMSLEQRKLALEEIAAAYDRHEVVMAADPVLFVRDMRSAFDQLVKYAESGHSSSEASSLAANLRSLQAEAKRLGASVEQLRKVNKGD